MRKGDKILSVLEPGHPIPTDLERRVKYATLDRITEEPEYCGVCTAEIKTMSFKGTGVCGDRCRKARAGIPLVTDRPKGAT